MGRISRYLIYCGAAFFTLATLAAVAPCQRGPLTLTLAAPKQPLKAGKPLLLSVKITNTSDRAVHISTSGGSGNVGKVYRVHVLDEQRCPAPRRARPMTGKRVFAGGSIPGSMLEQGESAMDRVNVTFLYDLTRPGKYNVWIAEPCYRGPHVKNGLVKSNTITVTVTK